MSNITDSNQNRLSVTYMANDSAGNIFLANCSFSNPLATWRSKSPTFSF